MYLMPKSCTLKNGKKDARHQWYMPVILFSRQRSRGWSFEAFRGQIVPKALSGKKRLVKWLKV
jgi:hypothetical protein